MNLTKKWLLRGVLSFAALLMAVNCFALSLQEAKDKGWVGEVSTGYLDIVTGESKELRALVNDINRQRKATYQTIAEKNGIPLEAVEQQAAIKAFEKTRAGHYIKVVNESWRKK